MEYTEQKKKLMSFEMQNETSNFLNNTTTPMKSNQRNSTIRYKLKIKKTEKYILKNKRKDMTYKTFLLIELDRIHIFHLIEQICQVNHLI